MNKMVRKVHALTPLSLALLLAFGGAGTAQAFTFANEEGTVKGSLDSTLTYGFATRLKDPDCALVGDPSYKGGSCGSSLNVGQWSNGDNGNLNYKKGDFFASYLKGTHELLLKMPDDVKFMARGTWLYDWKAADTRRSDLTSDAERQLTRNTRILDLWVSKDFYIGENSSRVRFGNQVQNWGESIFWMGGINATSAMDLQKYAVPGTQIKEVVLPAPMISFATGLGNGFNLDSYYQFRWEKHVYPASGGYWSASDIYGKGRQPVYGNNTNFNWGGVDAESTAKTNGLGRGPAAIAAAQAQLGAAPLGGSAAYPILSDKSAKNGGQYGLALHYKPESFKADFGFYYVNYHDKFPVLKYDNVNFNYQWQFLENRKMYGVSSNFPLGDWAMGAELSYRPKEAVALSFCYTPGAAADFNLGAPATSECEMWVDKAKTQLHLTAQLQLMPGSHGSILKALGNADTAYFTFEGVWTNFKGVNPGTQYNRTTKDGLAVMQMPSAGYYYWANTPNGIDPSGANPAGSTAIAGSQGTANSLGYAADFNWTYDNRLIPGWLVTPGVTLYHAFKGDTPVMYPNFLKGAKSAYFYVLFNQNPATWQAGINYTTFFGGDKLRQAYGDRDFIGGFISRNF